MGKVVIIGSINLDEVFHVTRIALPGETTLATDYRVHPGGKGANQAVAASRAGCPNVQFIAKVGTDNAGTVLTDALAREEIDLRLLVDDGTPSGRAMICVQEDGENVITVLSGANHAITEQEIVSACSDLQPDDVLLLQLEIPRQAVEAAIAAGAKAGCHVILNAAPADDRVDLTGVTLLVVNEHECLALSPSSHDALQAAQVLARQNGLTTVVTQGSRGAAATTSQALHTFSSPSVTPVDTTGAGDTFVGYLAAAVAAGDHLDLAITRAVHAGSLAVTRHGAMAAIPFSQEVDALVDAASSNDLVGVADFERNGVSL